uniref:Uncharacterized protein n=1 Tax=Anguilla anguilla TaxID=7936 RepID=A0A0E9VD12_ANGAN
MLFLKRKHNPLWGFRQPEISSTSTWPPGN